MSSDVGRFATSSSYIKYEASAICLRETAIENMRQAKEDDPMKISAVGRKEHRKERGDTGKESGVAI